VNTAKNPNRGYLLLTENRTCAVFIPRFGPTLSLAAF